MKAATAHRCVEEGSRRLLAKPPRPRLCLCPRSRSPAAAHPCRRVLARSPGSARSPLLSHPRCAPPGRIRARRAGRARRIQDGATSWRRGGRRGGGDGRRGRSGATKRPGRARRSGRCGGGATGVDLEEGITKLKNILEGKPEPHFSSEDYLMLYTGCQEKSSISEGCKRSSSIYIKSKMDEIKHRKIATFSIASVCRGSDPHVFRLCYMAAFSPNMYWLHHWHCAPSIWPQRALLDRPR